MCIVAVGTMQIILLLSSNASPLQLTQKIMHAWPRGDSQCLWARCVDSSWKVINDQQVTLSWYPAHLSLSGNSI